MFKLWFADAELDDLRMLRGARYDAVHDDVCAVDFRTINSHIAAFFTAGIFVSFTNNRIRVIFATSKL